MIVAELFANLGIKGADKTVNSLKEVGKSFENIKSTSLETKAAILAAAYAFERLVSASGKRGTELTNFNAVLGVSTDTLQRYQYAARRAGVSNEEVANSFANVQDVLTKASLGQGNPQGLADLSMKLGRDFRDTDLQHYAEHPEEFIKIVQQYMSKQPNVGFRNQNVKSFGFSNDMIAALSRGVFTDQNLKAAPTLNKSEIDSLTKSQVALADMKAQWELMIQKFMAANGMQIAKDLATITTNVIQLATALGELSKKLDLFNKFSSMAKDLGTIIKQITGFMDVGKQIDEVKNDKTGKKRQALEESILSGFGPGTQSFLKNTGVFDAVLDRVLGEKPVPSVDDLKKQLDGMMQKNPVMMNLYHLFDGPTSTPAKEDADKKKLTSGLFGPITDQMFGKEVEKTAPIPVQNVVPNDEKQSAADLAGGSKEPSAIRIAVPETAPLPDGSGPEPQMPAQTVKGDLNQVINVTQSIRFEHVGSTEDGKKAGAALKREINNALRQNNATVWGS